MTLGYELNSVTIFLLFKDQKALNLSGSYAILDFALESSFFTQYNVGVHNYLLIVVTLDFAMQVNVAFAKLNQPVLVLTSFSIFKLVYKI